jgi:CBS domain containing-hemolysin-like protein
MDPATPEAWPVWKEALVHVLAAAALLGIRALVAAIEAALTALGVPRARELGAAPGASRRARALAALVADPEATAFALRAGSTLSVLFAGVLAGRAGAALFPAMPAAAGALAALLVGLLSLPFAAAARGLGAAHGEPVALALAPPFRAIRSTLRPVARAVAFLAGRSARFTLPKPPLEEMERAFVEYAATQPGQDGETTSQLIHNVFAFRELVARDVMVPRTEVVAVEIDTPVPQILTLLAEEGHSRMPVYRESLDHVVGVLHVRDLVPLLEHPGLIVLRDLVRPAHFVPWSKPIDQLLREMQRKRLHMACVVDEYGGVMGICTIEDVLEQIVGDIQDEFEEGEAVREVEAHADGSFTVHGAASIAVFNKQTGAGVPEEDGYETVAGFVTALAGAIPAKGDRLAWRGWVFTVADADPRKVTKVRAVKVKGK